MTNTPSLTWRCAYHWLRVQAPGSLISWDDYKAFTGQDPKLSRSWITRVRMELEAHDGLTIDGQCQEGFRVSRSR